MWAVLNDYWGCFVVMRKLGKSFGQGGHRGGSR